MFRKLSLSVWCCALLVPAIAWGQDQADRNQLRQQPQFRLPFQQQPPIRSQMQQQSVPQQPATRTQPFQVQPQQVQRWLESLAPPQGNYPQQGQPYRQPNDSYPQRSYSYPQNSVRTRQGYTTSSPSVVRGPAPRAVLTYEQFIRLPEDEQRQQLQVATVSLEEALSRMSTGDSWVNYLHLQTILRMLASAAASELDEVDRLRLSTIADEFDAVQANPSFQRIWSLWGFQTLRSGLKAYAADPVERNKQQLQASAKQLRDSLDHPATGPGWKTYFQLDEIERLAQSADTSAADTEATLREIIARFDKTSANPDYGVLTQMTGFSDTRDSLAQLADRAQRLADSQPRDADDMQRVVRTILQHLDDIGQACQEQGQAQRALATSDTEKGRQALAVIRRRQNEAMQQAQDGLRALLTAIKKQDNSAEAMQKKRLANRADILKTIKKLKDYQQAADAQGIKVLKTPDSSGLLGTKKLSSDERQRGADLIKRLQVYDQPQAAPALSSKRLKLQWPTDRQDEADESKELADTNRVVKIVKKLFEDSDRAERVEEYILFQFEDVPEEGVVTLMQFSDAEPEALTLMQFSDVPEPEEVWPHLVSNCVGHFIDGHRR